MFDWGRDNLSLRRKHNRGADHKDNHKNDCGQTVPNCVISPAQGRNHWDDDNSDPRDRDVGQGDSHGGQLRALICILSQDTGHCAVWDIHSGIA